MGLLTPCPGASDPVPYWELRPQTPPPVPSALGVLNDYALYKSTHSLTHSPTQIHAGAPCSPCGVAQTTFGHFHVYMYRRRLAVVTYAHTEPYTISPAFSALNDSVECTGAI